MHDRLIMRCVQSQRDLPREAERFLHRHRPLPDPFPEGRPLDVLHDQIIGTNVVERADVGMVQRGDGLGFLLKASAETNQRSLDGDVAIQPRVTGTPHLTHTAPADGREYFVRSELVAG